LRGSVSASAFVAHDAYAATVGARDIISVRALASQNQVDARP
jgi:hypothetical protein